MPSLPDPHPNPWPESWPDFWIDAETFVAAPLAELVILPVPYEATTTYRKGCQHGPGAILAAADQLEHYDVELGQAVCFRLGVGVCEPVADSQSQPELAPEQMVEVVEQRVLGLLEAGKFVITLGGEHGITAGVVSAYQLHFEAPFTVVQIDAHGDLRHSYQGSIYNHACVMRRIVDMGIPTLPIAIRSICQEEAELIAAQQIPVIWDHDRPHQPDWIARAIAQIHTEQVFITIDLDGFDPALIPGVGTPQPGGLGWQEGTTFLRALFTQKTVIGADVMELAPLADSVVSEFTAAKLVYKLIGYYALANGKLV
ncbi:MAG: agmatinase [Cyanobacteria bacterium P01_G01_bin.54]